MPVRLIGSIILLVIVTIFCGFNLGDTYKSDLNLLFHTFHAVPVFLIVLGSFFAGCIVVLPFTFGKRRKSRSSNRVKADRGASQNATTATSAENPSSGAESASDVSEKKLSPFEAARQAGRERWEKTQAEKAEKKAKKEAEKAQKRSSKKAKSSGNIDSSVTHRENDVPVIKKD